MAIDVISGILDLWSSNETASYQKYMTRLKQQQLELDKAQNYNSALDTLIQMGSTYQDIGLQIEDIKGSTIEPLQGYFERYQGDYDYQMAQAQLNIDKYSNYFANYDQNRSLTMNAMFQNNIGTLRQMQENLASQQVLTAARGQGGATARLLSQMQMQEISNFAGVDQTLDAEGGIYGQQYQAQRTGLETEYSENKAAYDIAVMGKEQLQLDLETQYSNAQKTLNKANEAIGILQNSRKLYYSSFQDALASTIKAGHAAGQTYNDLGQKVDEYRSYLDITDEQFAKLKADVLEEWKPIDFEIRTKTYEWETGGESQHGANEHYIDYYQIYDKATGKLATQEQVENILRTYAGNLKEKDWYGTTGYKRYNGVGNSYGLSDKAIATIIKNSNYNKRKDYK